MRFNISPEGMARATSRRAGLTIGAWVVAVIVAMGLVATLIGDALTTSVGPTNEPESQEANRLLRQRFFVPGRETTEAILVRSRDLTVDDPRFEAYVEDLLDSLIGLGPEVIAGGTNFYQSGNEALVSLDRRTTFVVVNLLRSEANWDSYFDVFDQLGQEQRPQGSLSANESSGGFRVLSNNVGGSEMVVIRSDDLTVDDDDYRTFVEGLYFNLASLGRRAVWGGSYFYPLGAEALVSEDRHATLLTLEINDGDLIDSVYSVIENAESDSRFDVTITGGATLDHDFNELSERDLKEGELLFGLPMAVVVLILVFGALSTAAIPLIVAVVSIIVALGLSMLFAQTLSISVFIVNMIFMMGFAVGIDYCIFIVARYREERLNGMAKHDAIARAGGTASRAVLFSGLTVILSLAGLFLVQHEIFISLGLGAILVVLVSIVASLTLLPALLSLLGDKIDSLRIPFLYRFQATPSSESSAGMWNRIVKIVMKAPVVSIVLGAGLLIAAASPIVWFDMGTAGVATLPDDFRSKAGLVALQADFPAGLAEPVFVVVDGEIGDASVQQVIDRLIAAIDSDGAFGLVEQTTNDVGDLARLTVPIAGGDSRSGVAIEAVRRLRDVIVPEAIGAAPVIVLVTGDTAGVIDEITTGVDGLRVVIPFVLVLSFLLLTVVFRSLVVPIKAMIMNLLSVGAAYGLLVLVFQKGVGNDILGFRQVDSVEWWIPAFLFAVLFGLSMDYHVFLLSRIRERFHETHDNAGSVAFGIRSTGRLITGAALIMVAVFVGFASGDLVMFQQMGFGLAVAVALDATIVRSVLVPASMKLLGDRNWYLPSWLNWLPEFRTE